MLSPRCPDHGDLMRRLVLGELDDDRAAEQVRASCSSCAAWWDAVAGGPGLAEVAGGVDAALTSFSAPRQRRAPRWMAVAAAAVVAVGAGVMWVDQRGGTSPAGPAPADDSSLITRFSFEGDQVRAVGGAERPEQQSSSPLFDADMESGDLSAWTVVSPT